MNKQTTYKTKYPVLPTGRPLLPSSSKLLPRNFCLKLLTLLVTVLLTFSSCDLFFTPEENTWATLETVEDYENAIEGAYGLLTAAMDNNYAFYVNVKADDLSRYTGNYLSNYVPSDSDYSKNYYNDDTKTCPHLYDINLEDEFITGYTWTNFYKIISSLNNVITQYDQLKDDEEIKGIIGEAFLLRAYCYLRLTRIYGEIPLIEDVHVDYTISKSTFTEIYEFIEYDLLLARQLLPENNPSARIPMVTPHKGTALSVMAELYLCWAGYPVKDETKYELAANTAESLIDNMDVYGIGLMDDFAGLWEKENLYNQESILSIYFPIPAFQSNYGARYLFFGTYNERLGLSHRYDRLSYFATEYRFYNNYPKNYRRDVTFFNNLLYTNVERIGNVVYHIDTISLYIDQALPCLEIGYRKFYYDITIDEYEQYGHTYTVMLGSQRLDLFRFAHTLLTFAEASARSGNLNEKAYEAVNMIRRRANRMNIHTPSEFDLQPGLSAEAFADSVVWERAWELAGEPEGRWFDLVRLEMVEDLPKLRGIDDGDFPADMIATKDDYYFPIPEGDILLNPNLNIED